MSTTAPHPSAASSLPLVPVAAVWASAVTAAAAAGGLATDTSSDWYTELDLPSFQPPGPVFGVVWTVLYAMIATAATRATRAAQAGRVRRRVVWGVALNLLLNVAWTWIFFRAHRPVAAGVEILALQASTLLLIRQFAPIDRAAARLLMPYAGWIAFATVLTWTIAATNA